MTVGGEAMGKGMLRGCQGMLRAAKSREQGGEWEGGDGRVDRKDGGGEGGHGEAEMRRGIIWKGR